MTETLESKLTRIRIDETDVFLEDYETGRGKIIISNSYGHNYSYFWGAMGGDLKSFLLSINGEYFASKLMGAKCDSEMDVKRTFAGIRKYIAKDMCLPWYKHQEFQKDMRDVLNSFQEEMENYKSQDLFITWFYSSFINRLSFYLIEDSYDADNYETEFKAIDEPWHFIVTQPNPAYKWLMQFHKKLKTKLK